jgi:hypothetical protein
MIMAMIGVGMVASAFILAQHGHKQVELQIQQEEALQVAEIGLNEAIAEVRRHVIAAGSGWVEEDPDPGSPDTRSMQIMVGETPCTIRVRSAFLAYQDDPAGNAGWLQDVTGSRSDPMSEDFDIYEILAASGGVGDRDYQSGVRALITIPKSTLGNSVTSPLYIESDPDPHFAGNAFTISGEDHSMNPTQQSATIRMPYDGKVKINYEGSTAGLKSGFYLVDPYTGEEIMIFEDNSPGVSYPTDERQFTQEQCLNFFARTKGSAWGIGDYDHYTEDHDPYSGKPWAKKFVLDSEGRTYLKDGSVAYTHMKDGHSAVYDENGNEVDPVLVDINTPLTEYTYQNDNGQNVVTVRLGIEDLPGRYKKHGEGPWREPDWDWDDVVVKLDIVQTKCDTCGGAGFLTCSRCNGTGMKNKNSECNDCGGDGTVDCPDCNIEQYAATPWYEMAEADSLTGEPGVEAVSMKPTPVDEYGVHNDDETLNTRVRTLEEEWNATGISDNQVDQVRCDGTDEDGVHLGFDRQAVDSGTMQLGDRALASGMDAFTHSNIDLREMAAKIVGGTPDLLPGEVDPDTGESGGSVKEGVNEYDKIGNGKNHNDIGTKDNMKVTYINGDAGTLAGQIEGGGVLVINGDAHISGKWAYAGIVIVLGDLDITGGGNGLHILGSLMVEGEVKVAGNADIWWSNDAVSNAAAAAGNPSALEVHRRNWSQLSKGEVEALGL